MATVKENLIAAKALIDTPHKWVKADYESNGCFCAIGALAHVLHVSPDSDLGEIETALGREIPKDVLPASHLTYGTKVVKFNDLPGTTHADIMALFDRAIAAQDEVSA